MAIADHAGESDFQPGTKCDPLRQGLDPARPGRPRLFLRAQAAGAGDERERHPVHLRVFRVEMALVVQGVTHSPQTTADHLLTQELGAERPDAEDVGDGVAVAEDHYFPMPSRYKR